MLLLSAALFAEEKRGLSGMVTAPNGKPCGGVAVVLCGIENRVLQIRGEKVDHEAFIPNYLAGNTTTTAEDGTFQLPYIELSPETIANDDPKNRPVDIVKRRPLPYSIVCLHDVGYAVVDDRSYDKLPVPQKITLTPWSRIEGTAKVGKEFLVEKPLEIYYKWPQPTEGADDVFGSRKYQGEEWPLTRSMLLPDIGFTFDVTTGKSGEFVFEKVPQGTLSIVKRLNQSTRLETKSGELLPYLSAMSLPMDQMSVETKPGETTRIQFGGNGRPLVGKVEIADKFAKQLGKGVSCNILLKTKVRCEKAFADIAEATKKMPQEVKDELGFSPRDLNKTPKFKEWLTTDEGKKFKRWEAKELEVAQRNVERELRAEEEVRQAERTGGNGFRFNDVPGGEWTVEVVLTEYDEKPYPDHRTSVDVMVPPGTDDMPIDVGTVSLKE